MRCDQVRVPELQSEWCPGPVQDGAGRDRGLVAARLALPEHPARQLKGRGGIDSAGTDSLRATGTR
jgi:hypothetical protein